ncbi:hypothetical protein ACNUDN_01784 [Mycobacterium sp. smrl_JER01]
MTHSALVFGRAVVERSTALPRRMSSVTAHIACGMTRSVTPAGFLQIIARLASLGDGDRALAQALSRGGLIDRTLAPGGLVYRILTDDGFLERLIANDGLIERLVVSVSTIADAVPVIESLEATVNRVAPVLERLEPHIAQLAPVLDSAEPSVAALTPAITTIAPAVEQLAPMIAQLSPVLDRIEHFLRRFDDSSLAFAKTVDPIRGWGKRVPMVRRRFDRLKGDPVV